MDSLVKLVTVGATLAGLVFAVRALREPLIAAASAAAAPPPGPTIPAPIIRERARRRKTMTLAQRRARVFKD